MPLTQTDKQWIRAEIGHQLAEATRDAEGKPRSAAAPFDAALNFAARRLKGDERRVVELVCQGHAASNRPPGSIRLTRHGRNTMATSP